MLRFCEKSEGELTVKQLGLLISGIKLQVNPPTVLEQ